MIRFRHARLAFFPTAFWAIGLLAGAQTTWHVDVSAPGSGDGSPGSPFTSIQAGIDATVDGDTVLVAPGNYLESIDFFDKAITVRSAAGPERTAILPPDAFQDSLVRILGPNIPLGTLEGFTVAGNDFVSGSQGSKGILSERGVIRRCIVRENYFGISNPYDTYVHESTVVQNAGGGMVGGGLSIHYVFNSIVDSILANAFAPSSFISYSNFSYSGGPEINGTGNIDADPQFWGEACNDFHLQAGSPCRDAGDPSSPTDPDGSRIDMGALTYEPGYLPGPASFCTALPNSTGSTAAMTWAGTTSIAANDLILGASGMPIGNTGVFIASPDAVELPLGDGNLCLGSSTLGFVLRLQPSFVASRTGTADLSLDHDTPPTPEAQVVAGSTWFYQAWFRDLVPGGSGFNFSEGLRVTYCP